MESTSIPQSSKTTFNLDLSVYPLVAIQKAAYEFSNRASCLISRATENRVTVQVDLGSSVSDASQFAREFVNRVADLAIQSQIDCQTRLVREALVRAALSEAFLK